MSTTTTDQRDAARFQEQIAATYRDWLAYLTAQLALLDVQVEQGREAFERAESCEDDERAARVALAAIRPGQRALFDAVYAQECAELQDGPVQEHHGRGQTGRQMDPDEVRRTALTNLLQDAKGVGTEHGRGLLPRGKPDAIKWYGVDVAALSSLPTAAAYALGGDTDADRKRVLRVVGGGVAMILLILIWMLVSWGAQPALRDQVPVTANGAAVNPWAITTLRLLAGADDVRTLRVSGTNGETWPAGEKGMGRVFWRTGSIMPIRLCASAAALANATTLHLMGAGETPTRVFTLRTASDPPVDLVIEPCERGQAAAVRYGDLREVVMPRTFAVGEAALLTGTLHLTVTAITLMGTGEDPTLPANQSRVSVQVLNPAAQDWPRLMPTLLLPDGNALLPSETVTTTQGVELRYLTPQPAGPLDVVWSVTPDAQTAATRWRATLAPPPSRSSVLHAALSVRRVTAAPGTMPGTITVQITVANQRAAPLLLTADDITLSVQERLLAAPDRVALQRPLMHDETRTFTLAAPAQDRLILRVGTERYAIPAP